MKMKQLLILVGVVIVLWVIFVLLEQSSVPTAEESYLVEIDTTTIDEVEIMRGGQTVTLERRGDGWYLTNPIEYRANPRYVSQMLEKLTEMRIESEVTSSKDRWSEFEVDTAGVALTVREDSVETRLVLGKAADSYRQSYARLADEETVYLVNGTYKTTLSRSAENWRDRSIFPHQQHDIVTIETDEYSLYRDGDNWTMTVDGDTVAVDKPKAVRVQSAISRMRTSEFPEPADYETVDWAHPDATLRVGLEWGDEVPIRFYLDPENERRYYVRYGDERTVYLVYEGVYNQVFKSPDDLKPSDDASTPRQTPPPRPQG
ncbi:MAG: hypothetical protein MAG453_00240 [Calditrichaeota bacterium]|nr:hypothetical protein [Calditrichota bacterium]